MDKPQFEAIEHLKKLVTSTPVLQFFNPNNSIRPRTDASAYGLGAMVEQEFNGEWKPLTACEKQYAQIENKSYLQFMAARNFTSTCMDMNSTYKTITNHCRIYLPSLYTNALHAFSAFI